MNSVDELNLLLGIGPKRPQLPVTLRRSGYLPVRALGKGSYGQALLVFHEPQQQYFVVKHLNLAGMSSRQRHDAHNEISILQKLHHPNIVRYVEYYEEHPNLYIVMEYADGGDVYSLLSSAQAARRANARAYRGLGPASSAATSAAAAASSGLLSEAQVVSLFVQTTMAVKYMHDRRLLHRDIKSSNIFLTKNHIVKLGDFGISTVLQSTMAMASTMCGTPCYFSPELCQGRPYNNKSDMWALGVLLYELCAGHVPFESTTMKTLMRDIVHKQPPRIPAMYAEPLWELVGQLLQKDPRRRPDAGQVLLSPALMKYVPELIDQLASDPAYAAAAKAQRQESCDGDSKGNYEAGVGGSGRSPTAPPQAPQRPFPAHNHHSPTHAAAAAPAPPPRRPPSANAASPHAEEATSGQLRGGAVRAAAPSASASRLTGGEGRAAAPPPPPAEPSPSSSPSSIAALLARFDAQKQQLAESKARKRDAPRQPAPTGDQQPTPSGAAGHSNNNSNVSTGNDRNGARAAQALRNDEQQQQLQQHSPHRAAGGGAAAVKAPAVPYLSPGAVAALRQQGYNAESDSQIFSAAGQREKNAGLPLPVPVPGQRRSFAPPPLPAALRDATAGSAHNGKSGGKGNSSNSNNNGGNISSPSAGSSNRKSGSGEGNGAGGTPTRFPGAKSGSGHDAVTASPLRPVPAVGSSELGAVLSELSSWRERSLKRQRRHHSGSDASALREEQKEEAATRSQEGAGDKGGGRGGSSGVGTAKEKHRGSAAAAAAAVTPPMPPQPSLPPLKPRVSSSDVHMSAQAATAVAKDSVSGGKAEASKGHGAAAAAALSSPSKAPQASRNVSSVAAPVVPKVSPKEAAGADDVTSPAPARLSPSPPTVETTSPAPPPPSSLLPSPPPPRRATTGEVVERAVPQRAVSEVAGDATEGEGEEEEEDDDDDAESSAQSFVDVMGTTIDVTSLQSEASRVAALTAAATGRHGHQQSMHRSFQGTSEKIDALRSTLPAGSVHVLATARSGREVEAAGTPPQPSGAVDGDSRDRHSPDGGDVGAADLHFSTSCLCGGVTTHHGCLSMIYGSFVCACDVCVRFTGAAQGLEWLHLPEAEGLASLRPSRTATDHHSHSTSREPSPLAAERNGSPPSQPLVRRSSAGAGAVAAASLRTAAQHSVHDSPAAAAASSLPLTAHGATPPAHVVPNPTASNGGETGEGLLRVGVRSYTHQQPPSSPPDDERPSLSDVGDGASASSAAADSRKASDAHAVLRAPPFPVKAALPLEEYVLYTCVTCGGLLGMRHDGVEGLLVPKAALDEQSLRILSSCAQTVSESGEEC